MTLQTEPPVQHISDFTPWTELRVLRRKDAMTLEQLSGVAGIALGHLSDLENGKRKPTARIIAKLADAMNVPKSMLEPRAAA